MVAMAVAPDGRHLLTASADQSLTLWKLTVVEGQRGGPLGDIPQLPVDRRFSPDGTTLAVAAGGFGLEPDDETDLFLYDAATKAEKHKVTFPGSVRSIPLAGRRRDRFGICPQANLAGRCRHGPRGGRAPGPAGGRRPASPRAFGYTRVAFSPRRHIAGGHRQR